MYNMIDKNYYKNSPAFTAYYRVPNTSINKEKVLEAITKYQQVKNRVALAYEGKNPLQVDLKTEFENLAREQGGSLSWLAQNAKYYGIKIPEIKTDVITIVTDNNDIIGILNFLKKRLKSYNIFSRIYNLVTNKAGYSLKNPEHINYLKSLLHIYNTEEKEFSKFIANKKICNYNSTDDLLNAMMTET